MPKNDLTPRIVCKSCLHVRVISRQYFQKFIEAFKVDDEDALFAFFEKNRSKLKCERCGALGLVKFENLGSIETAHKKPKKHSLLKPLRKSLLPSNKNWKSAQNQYKTKMNRDAIDACKYTASSRHPDFAKAQKRRLKDLGIDPD